MGWWNRGGEAVKKEGLRDEIWAERNYGERKRETGKVSGV